MALTPGTRLGPYAITAQIGVGGVGKVYPVAAGVVQGGKEEKTIPAKATGCTVAGVREGKMDPRQEEDYHNG